MRFAQQVFLGAFLDFCDSFEGNFSYGDSGKYCFVPEIKLEIDR